MTTRGGLLTLLGIVVALCGIVIVSVAGHRKEIALGSEIREFDVKKGLLLAIMCGIFSSGMSFAIDAARPIQAAALAVGVNRSTAALPSYVIIMGGGGLVNFAYCFSRLAFKKELSVKADLALPGATLFKNGTLAATGGIMWYLQFFFYAWGAANIPATFAYVNWMLHMSGYVLFGGIVGLALANGRAWAQNPYACSGPACWSSSPQPTSSASAWHLNTVTPQQSPGATYLVQLSPSKRAPPCH